MDSMTSTTCKVNRKSCNTSFSAKEIMNFFLGIENAPTYKILNLNFSQDDLLVITLERKGRWRTCLNCGRCTSKKHSVYIRTVKDISFGDRRVIIKVVVSKYECENEECPRKIFSEDLPGLADRYAHFSIRANHRIVKHSLENSSRNTAKILGLDHLEVSPSTCLRRLYPLGEQVAQACSSTYVGIDDFAFCRGRTYMSVVVDIFTHRVVAVISCRSGRELDNWLKKNPQIKVITRDRGKCFVDAITCWLPNAIQICDRFHLIKNLTDTMTEEIKGLLKKNTLKMAYPYPSKAEAEEYIENAIKDMGEQKDRTKMNIYWTGMKLKSQGFSYAEIAKRLEVTSRRVYQILNCVNVNKILLESQKRAFRYQTELARYICGGCLSIRSLCEKMGGKLDSRLIARITLKLRMVYQKKRQAVKEHNQELTASLNGVKVSAKTIRKFILDGSSDNQRLKDLMKTKDDIACILAMCIYFRKMIMGDSLFNNLDLWIREALKSPSRALANFAYGIMCDRNAVYNAITLPYSNGLLEGTVNKIKTIKRAMYNRAGIKLLRAKLIHNITYESVKLHQI